MIESDLRVVAEKLKAADRILLTSHRSPDGDGVGSMVALAALLRDAGKRATLFSRDPVPRNLKWLPLVKTWTRKLKQESKYQVTVILDCGDAKLLGGRFPAADITGEVLVLDHHASARPFGDVFVSDSAAAATGVLIARLAAEMGLPLTNEAALGIWVALVSDTGSFRYSNTNAEALSLASRLVDSHGVDPWAVSERLDENVPLRRYKLLAKALQDMEMVLGGQVALMVVTQETVDQCGATWEDTEGLVNYGRSIDGVECGLLLTPAKWGGVRVSLRSKGRVVDAGALCHSLGGGGHRGAAGCTLKGTIAEGRETLLSALAEALGAKTAKTEGAAD